MYQAAKKYNQKQKIEIKRKILTHEMDPFGHKMTPDPKKRKRRKPKHNLPPLP